MPGDRVDRGDRDRCVGLALAEDPAYREGREGGARPHRGCFRHGDRNRPQLDVCGHAAQCGQLTVGEVDSVEVVPVREKREVDARHRTQNVESNLVPDVEKPAVQGQVGDRVEYGELGSA